MTYRYARYVILVLLLSVPLRGKQQATAQQTSDPETVFKSLQSGAGMHPFGDVSFALKEPTSDVIAPSEVSFAVDSSSQKITIKLSPIPRDFPLAQGWPTLATLVLKSESRAAGTYLGQNVYGATAQVTDVRASDYGLAFDRTSWIFRSFLTIALPPGEAGRILPNLKLVVVCGAQAPWTVTSVDHLSATVASPSDYWLGSYYSVVYAERMELYDTSTGTLLKTFTESSTAAEYSNEHPLHVEISTKKFAPEDLYYQVDDGPEQWTGINPSQTPFLVIDAKSSVRLSRMSSQPELVVKLNGQVVHPKWQADKREKQWYRISTFLQSR